MSYISFVVNKKKGDDHEFARFEYSAHGDLEWVSLWCETTNEFVRIDLAEFLKKESKLKVLINAQINHECNLRLSEWTPYYKDTETYKERELEEGA